MESASSAAAAKRCESSTREAQTNRLWEASIDGHGGGSGGCAVTLRNVFFAYPTRPETEVLCNFSLEVPCGQRIALVGASGNGKSTVFSLLVHFYEARSGTVALDGVDVKEMRHELLHQRVALVSQEPVLMSGTVEENILYGLGAFAHAADGDDAAAVARRSTLRARMIAAATAANAHSFIMHELGDGYQTPVGERGVQLSGGQKQRIAIARCLMLDPQLLLLDEATSALDTESEAAVQLALETAMVGRTTLIIAHRLSTVRHADQIVMMHAGAVVEQGTHVELMAKQLPADGRPSYRHLVGEQVESGSR
jgi:ABC-type multidrug transport system fused ATPase/permease subunit